MQNIVSYSKNSVSRIRSIHSIVICFMKNNFHCFGGKHEMTVYTLGVV